MNLSLLLTTLLLTAHADPFWWGVGHASFQVEGQPADSDWRRWVAEKGNVADGTNADRATEFWAHPERDLDLARDLGAKMFRLSLAWERIQPAPDKWDDAALERYEGIIGELRQRGIEPLVTLHHFVLPGWLAERGGLTAPEFADHFSAYALRVVRRLARGPARVRWWMTFNEPIVLVFAGYVTGEWPPNRRDLSAAARAEAGVAKAHLKAMQAIRGDAEIPAGLKFSVAAHWRDFHAEGFGPLNAVARGIAGWIFNRQFVNSITSGRVFAWTGALPVWENVGLPEKGTSLDYLGVNYYGRTVVRMKWWPPSLTSDEGEGERTDVGWVVYPNGLGHVLAETHRLYGLPLLVSENGVADRRDVLRPAFLKSHVAQIENSVQNGVPVIGYLHWSLTDNFEWAKGLEARFGLVEMDYVRGVRKPRASFFTYKDLIKASRL